jgi:hypothetical protein
LQCAVHRIQQDAVGRAELRCRQVVIARPLVAQRALDQDEVRRRLQRRDLPRRCNADEQATSGSEQLFRDQHGEGCADGAADYADRQAAVFEEMEIGMVAGPAVMATHPPLPLELADDVAVRIQQADLGHRVDRDRPLAPRLAQQALGRERRWGAIVLVREDGGRLLMLGHPY